MDSTLFSAAAYEIPSICATCATVSISFLVFLLLICANDTVLTELGLYSPNLREIGASIAFNSR